MAAARAAAAAPLEAAAARDVLLFRHERGRALRVAALCCAGQGLLWAYLARVAFTALRPVPGPAAGPDHPLRPRDNKWRFGFAASCLTLGTGRRRERDGERGSDTGSGAGRAGPGGSDTETGQRVWGSETGTGLRPGLRQRDRREPAGATPDPGGRGRG